MAPNLTLGARNRTAGPRIPIDPTSPTAYCPIPPSGPSRGRPTGRARLCFVSRCLYCVRTATYENRSSVRAAPRGRRGSSPRPTDHAGRPRTRIDWQGSDHERANRHEPRSRFRVRGGGVGVRATGGTGSCSGASAFFSVRAGSRLRIRPWPPKSRTTTSSSSRRGSWSAWRGRLFSPRGSG